jgi:hypothetical protein
LREELTEKASENGPATPVKAAIVFPDRVHLDVQTPRGILSIVATPAQGFMSAPGMGARDMPAAEKNETIAQIHRDMIYVGQHLDDQKSIFFAAGSEQIGDIGTRVVEVRVGDAAIRWYVDPKTGYILREAYEGVARSGPFHGETDLSDWKTTEGITLPALRKNRQDGRQTSIVELTGIEFNPAIDPKLFEKPTVETTMKSQ